jgi:hypothetical protein
MVIDSFSTTKAITFAARSGEVVREVLAGALLALGAETKSHMRIIFRW